MIHRARPARNSDSVSKAFDSRHASAFPVAQSTMATGYRKPRRIGMYATSAHQLSALSSLTGTTPVGVDGAALYPYVGKAPGALCGPADFSGPTGGWRKTASSPLRRKGPKMGTVKTARSSSSWLGPI